MTDSRPHIMLIDDEPGVLTALKLMLGALGASVETFPGGAEALEVLRGDTHFDFILCDLRMPDLDGIEVLQEAKKIRPALPFVLISGHATNADIDRARELGSFGFLGKPFAPEAVCELLGLGSSHFQR